MLVSCPSIMTVSPCRKLYVQSLEINLQKTCLSACKKSTSSLTSFMRYCKDIANLLFCEFWECLIIPIKNYSCNMQKTFTFICMQKINLITHFFQRYRKEITNLLFWVIWAYLAAHTKNDSINLKKPFTFICRQRINFILHLCLKILQRYHKLVMLGIWACLGTHK